MFSINEWANWYTMAQDPRLVRYSYQAEQSKSSEIRMYKQINETEKKFKNIIKDFSQKWQGNSII